MAEKKVIIGLEIHVQLTTGTKLFCGCPNKFSNEPNENVCETCLGMPGSKPVLNEKAVDMAAKIAMALNCKMPKEMLFSRKSYFYPDMSKNFQITQYEAPIATNGFVIVGEVPNDKKIRIRRIHMEEDPARIVNEGAFTLIDYNRSGTPLCEIVTEPDFSSPQEARLFLQKLSSILEYLDVYDSSIEGSMRVDSNISLEGGARVEIKNISGFKDVESALNYEIGRQRNAIQHGEKIFMETRGWDAATGTTKSQRIKEEEEDYGYITDTDLPRITLSKKFLSGIAESLPEFSEQKIRRYRKEFGIQREIAVSIADEPGLAEMFEKAVKEVEPKLAAEWFAGELKKTLNYNNLKIKNTGLKAEHIIKLLKMLEKGEITIKTSELAIREMVLKPDDPERYVEKKKRIHDSESIEKAIKEALNENAKAVLDYKTGKQEAFNFLVGQIMRKMQGRGDPVMIRELLKKKI